MDLVASMVAARWISSHRQIVVKVNARTDEGVAGIVEVLSRIPQVQTKSSCEGEPNSYLEVLFIYDASPTETVRFMHELRFTDFPSIRVSAVPQSEDRLLVRLKAPNGDLPGLVDSLSTFAANWLASRNSS